MMKKFFAALITMIIMLTAANIPALALDISGVDTEDIPTIRTKISAEPGSYDALDETKIKATLDGQELVTGIIEKEDSSVEWIIVIDTSKSLSEAHFKAQKDAVLAVYKELRDSDRLVLYTFDERVIRVLSGIETYEQAKKKIDAITCEGQDTAFYAAAKQLANLAKQSTSAVCVPVIFSDGVETTNPEDRAKTLEALKQSPVPIHGFYPDVASEEIKNSFNQIINTSGGTTKSFNTSNAIAQLASFNSNDTYSISFTATKGFAANNKSVLEIDMGDGNKVKKEIVVPEWEGDKEPPKVVSAVSDEERNIITVMFSEPIKNCTNENIYSFTCDEESEPPKIHAINKTSENTVVIEVNTLGISNVKLHISGYMDAGDNVGEDDSFTITIDQGLIKTLIMVGVAVAVAVIVVIAIIIIIAKKKKIKTAIENGAVQAAYKNGKKIEQKQKPAKEKIEKAKEAKKSREEKIAEEKAEKARKKEEERKKAEAEKFKFYFEEKSSPDDRED